MDVHAAAILLNTAICVAMIGLIAFRLWPHARRESLQQELFKIRNDLFLFMCENGHRMEDPAYRQVRRGLNGAIRLAETFNVPTMIVSAICLRHIDTEVDHVRNVTDTKLKTELRKAEDAMAYAVMRYMLFSPLGAAGLAVFAVYAIMHFGWNQLQLSNLRPVRAFMNESRCTMAH